MVVNSIIVAMVSHTNWRSDGIYQMGSSVRNPVRYVELQDYGFRYFTENPWINKEGKPIKVGKVTVLRSMDSFHRYMAIRYTIWLKVHHRRESNHDILLHVQFDLSSPKVLNSRVSCTCRD